MSEWLKEHAWKLTPAARADAQQIPPTHFRFNVNRTGFIGGLFLREDGAHGTTQQVFTGGTRACRPDGLRPRPRASVAMGGDSVSRRETRDPHGIVASLGAAGGAQCRHPGEPDDDGARGAEATPA